MKRIKLGQTLRKIANEGVQTFYNGSLADQIVDEIQKKGFSHFFLIFNYRTQLILMFLQVEFYRNKILVNIKSTFMKHYLLN